MSFSPVNASIETSSNETTEVDISGELVNTSIRLTTPLILDNTTRIYGNDGLIGTLVTDDVVVLKATASPKNDSFTGNATSGDLEAYLNLTTGQLHVGGDATYTPMQDPKVTYTEPKKDYLQDMLGNDTLKIILAVTLGFIIVAVLVCIVISKRRGGTGSMDPSQGEWRAQSYHRESDVDGTGSVHLETQV